MLFVYILDCNLIQAEVFQKHFIEWNNIMFAQFFIFLGFTFSHKHQENHFPKVTLHLLTLVHWFIYLLCTSLIIVECTVYVYLCFWSACLLDIGMVYILVPIIYVLLMVMVYIPWFLRCLLRAKSSLPFLRSSCLVCSSCFLCSFSSLISLISSSPRGIKHWICYLSMSRFCCRS